MKPSSIRIVVRNTPQLNCAEVMNTYGIRASVGRIGSCYDNAAAESFNATCKKEVVNRKIYPTRKHAIKDVTAWIELRYNHKTTPLSARVPNPQPRPPTMEPTPESSLEIPFFNSVHKTHSTPDLAHVWCFWGWRGCWLGVLVGVVCTSRGCFSLLG